MRRQAKGVIPGAAAKASLNRATVFGPQWRVIDPKPGELAMARVKRV